MAAKIEEQRKEDTKLKEQLDGIDWPIDYGNIKLQLRQGRVTLLVIERTVKLD